jgi:hypothetical protein
MRSLIGGLMVVLLFGSSAHADIVDPPALLTPHSVRDPWHLDWIDVNHAATHAAYRPFVLPVDLVQQPDNQPLHAVAIEHSQAYQTRAKIHKYASFATLPLFGAELALGQSLYNTPATEGGKRGLHAAVGAGIIGLVAVNTVTGAWNLFGEGRTEKEGRTLRLVHGLLMMAADGGFVASWASAPHHRRLGTAAFDNNKAMHRDIAIASISVGTAGYLLMLLGNH